LNLWQNGHRGGPDAAAHGPAADDAAPRQRGRGSNPGNRASAAEIVFAAADELPLQRIIPGNYKMFTCFNVILVLSLISNSYSPGGSGGADSLGLFSPAAEFVLRSGGRAKTAAPAKKELLL
jgi:hypothetical protein